MKFIKNNKLTSWIILNILFNVIFLCSLQANIYHDTVDQIKKIYRNSTKHTHVDFLNLDIIRSETKFKEFLKQLADNDQGILHEVAAYYHPAGFIKIVLYKGKNNEQLRFHFWGKGGTNAIKQSFNDGWEPIHNHRWNFSSKVIRGGLDSKEYLDADSRIRFDIKQEAEAEILDLNSSYKLYDVCIIPTRLDGDDYSIFKTGKFAIIGNYTRKYMQAGSAYYLDHRIPHQVKPEPDTSTLLLMDPPSKLIASEIFISRDDHFQEEFKLQDLNFEETQKYLREFLDSVQ